MILYLMFSTNCFTTYTSFSDVVSWSKFKLMLSYYIQEIFPQKMFKAELMQTSLERKILMSNIKKINCEQNKLLEDAGCICWKPQATLISNYLKMPRFNMHFCTPLTSYFKGTVQYKCEVVSNLYIVNEKFGMFP